LITTARLRLADLEKEDRQSAEHKTEVRKGKLTFRDAAKIVIERIEADPNLEPRTKDYYQQRLEALEIGAGQPLLSMRLFGTGSVMIAKLSNEYVSLERFVDHTMLVCNPSGPVSRECVPEGFRLADTDERISHYIFDQLVNPSYQLRVSPLPV